MVGTFKALGELAEFDGVEDAARVEEEAREDDHVSEELAAHVTHLTRSGGGLTINVNIEIAVPATDDATVYDNFFAALSKHVLTE